MTTLMFLLAITACLATLGRIATPRAERLPWRTWTCPDLVTNVARGVCIVAESNAAQRHLWDLYHHQLTHPPRRPDHPVIPPKD